MIIALCEEDEEVLTNQSSFVNKCDLTLVQIIKQEWPTNWPDFIPDLISSSHYNISVCENNMIILKLLSEEIFEFSENQMTFAKASNMKLKLSNDFLQIFNLCYEILLKSSTINNKKLTLVTLKCLLCYVNWIPIDYIFKSDLLLILSSNLLSAADVNSTSDLNINDIEIKSLALKCLTEISSRDDINNNAPAYNQQITDYFTNIVQYNRQLFNSYSNDGLKTMFEKSSTSEKEYIQDFTIFLCTFLSKHLLVIENQQPNLRESSLFPAHTALIELSKIDDKEIFKICLDYWTKLLRGLSEQIQQLSISTDETTPMLSGQDYMNSNSNSSSIPILYNNGEAISPGILDRFPLRKHIYSMHLSQVRGVIISKMAKPEEVLIVENDEGEIVREFVQETDNLLLYSTMREILVYLTHLDVADTEKIMLNKLSKQMDGSEWSWHNINTLCWAIGSISGTMSEQMERSFVVQVLRDLLALTEKKKGTSNKAVCASNIMYIISQYPRFLKANWQFLKTVVNKLFEFMHETHEGVQDMACDTFITICQSCKNLFVILQPNEYETFIVEIIKSIPTITSDLSPQQTQLFYKAVGMIISASNSKTEQIPLLNDALRLPLTAWRALCTGIEQNPNQLLQNPEPLKILINVLKTFGSLCSSISEPIFYTILTSNSIFRDSLSVYITSSSMIVDFVTNNTHNTNDPMVLSKTPFIRGLRSLKKEILQIFIIYINKTSDGSKDSEKELIKDLLPFIFNTVLPEYNQTSEFFRNSEVLKCMRVIIEKLGPWLPNEATIMIIDNVFECTLDMINKDFIEYPDHRIEFYKLLKQLNLKCFSTFITIKAEIFDLFINSILWAFKHNNSEIESIGLSISIELLANIYRLDTNNHNQQEEQFITQFYQSYYFPILKDTFYVLTEMDHKAQFRLQSLLIQKLIQLVQLNRIKIPLYSQQDQNGAQNYTNSDFVKQSLGNMLLSAFDQLQQQQVENFIQALFSYHQSSTKFKSTLRDFLVQIREYGGDPTDYLFAEEHEQELAREKESRIERAKKIAGLMKPSDMMMED